MVNLNFSPDLIASILQPGCSKSASCFPQYEILLCVQDHDDPAIDVCKKLLGKYPNVDARLFIGEYVKVNPISR